jgi:hypothetical protein
MTVLITLTIAGTDSGPFNLYSNVDNYTVPFQTGVAKSVILSGYSSTLVPNNTSIIRIKSTGVCTNYIDLPILGISTTTTSSTTTTTTTLPLNCKTYKITSSGTGVASGTYLNCGRKPTTYSVGAPGFVESITICAIQNSITSNVHSDVVFGGSCDNGSFLMCRAPNLNDNPGFPSASQACACTSGYDMPVLVHTYDPNLPIGTVIYMDAARTEPYPFSGWRSLKSSTKSYAVRLGPAGTYDPITQTWPQAGVVLETVKCF